MQVRIFESPDMTSGLKMIKKELGPDALILSTRTVRNGKMGLLGKPMLEITAAIDPEYPAENGRKNVRVNRRDGSTAPSRKMNSAGFSHVVNDGVESYLPSDSGMVEDLSNLSPSTSVRKVQDPLQCEVNELKDLVASLAGQITRLATREDGGSANAAGSGDTGALPDAASSSPAAEAADLVSLLAERGIDADAAKRVAAHLRQRFPHETNRAEKLPELLQKTIQDLIATSPPDFHSDRGQHRIALIGPTGVGKTTTLAKIAAYYLSNFSGSIALITIDTYRIAAVEQLKVYGEIMHLPVEVVINPAQLQEALGKHNDKDLILIDTAGRSPRDTYSIDELGSFLRPEFGIEKHLVVSATTRENELAEITERFSRLVVDKTIFTKIDECSCLGSILNLQMRGSAPLSYITNGQRVPEDLLQVDPRIVAELIMTHYQGPLHE
jgi:flagellar biosynthesis protein FlhF